MKSNRWLKIFWSMLAATMMVAFSSQTKTKKNDLRGEEKQSSIIRSRQLLGYEPIAGYEPYSLVTDHNALDLDFFEMQKQLALGSDTGFMHGRAVYYEGAFSRPYAILKVDPNDADILAGTRVEGFSVNEEDLVGFVMEDYSANSTTLKVLYDISPVQSDYVRCHVGANPNPEYGGCFKEESGLVIDGRSGLLVYKYNYVSENKNDRSIMELSTKARDAMLICPHMDGCPYRDYEKYLAYYGDPAYANTWIISALDEKRTTDFEQGIADFGGGYSEPVRAGKSTSWWQMVQCLKTDHGLRSF
jgi:hypothetical protein